MKFNETTRSWHIKGNKGFNFEFKTLDNGNIAFIRYQDGDREGSPTCHILTGLGEDKNAKALIIDKTLKNYAGVSIKIYKAVRELIS